ncbi:MAG: hypothetical protein SPL08_01085, partial [Pseudomonadota bacterium]|nr:hypothetical protein [Pseudomonadota bacterium]
FVTGIYTYYAPLLDGLTYLLISNLNSYPAVISFITGSLHGIIYIGIFLLMSLFIPRKTKTDKFLFGTLFAYAVMGYSLLRQLGTSAHEIDVAIIFIFALYLFFKNTFIDKKYSPKILCSIGGLIGIALGLKLTIFPMCFALGVTALFCSLKKQFIYPIKTLVWLFIGSVFGLALTDGWWMYLTWKQTGNPIFPILNQIFKSPLFSTENTTDLRFMPKTIGQALFYPLYWAMGTEYVTDMDMPVYNIHAILPFICALFLTGKIILGRVKSPSERAIIIFYNTAYVMWLIMFSILRYAVVLEILSGIMIFLVIKSFRTIYKTLWGGFILLLALLCPIGYPTFSLIVSKTYVPEPSITVSDDTVVMVAEDLSSIVVPFIHTTSPVLGWTASYFLDPIPQDPETILTYKNILKGKKMMVVSLIKTNEVYQFYKTLNLSKIECHPLPQVFWGMQPVIMYSHRDTNGTYHGFEIPDEYLNQFLEQMTAVSFRERFYYKKQ